jgi:hypothetical protein
VNSREMGSRPCSSRGPPLRPGRPSLPRTTAPGRDGAGRPRPPGSGNPPGPGDRGLSRPGSAAARPSSVAGAMLARERGPAMAREGGVPRVRGSVSHRPGRPAARPSGTVDSPCPGGRELARPRAGTRLALAREAGCPCVRGGSPWPGRAAARMSGAARPGRGDRGPACQGRLALAGETGVPRVRGGSPWSGRPAASASYEAGRPSVRQAEVRGPGTGGRNPVSFGQGGPGGRERPGRTEAASVVTGKEAHGRPEAQGGRRGDAGASCRAESGLTGRLRRTGFAGEVPGG